MMDAEKKNPLDQQKKVAPPQSIEKPKNPNATIDATEEKPINPPSTEGSGTDEIVKNLTTFGDKTEKTETTTAAPPSPPAPPATTADDGMGGFALAEKILKEARDRYKPETEEEQKKRLRKEKSKKIVAAITDGLNSLSNLYFTTQYAPNMYDHEKQSTLKPYEERLEKEKKDREANNDKYDALNLKLAENEINSAKNMRELQAALEKRRIEIEKNRRDAEQHEWKRLLMPYQYSSEINKADKAKYDAQIAKSNADYSGKIANAKLESQEALTTQRESAARKNNRWTPSAGRSGVNSSKGGKYVAYDREGNAHYFPSNSSADDFAKANGTYEYPSTSTSKGFSGGEEVSKTRKTGGYRKRPENKTKTSSSTSTTSKAKKSSVDTGDWAKGLSLKK